MFRQSTTIKYKRQLTKDRHTLVSTIKELSRRWYPRAYYQSPEKTGNHRALGDIRDSINELRYYREAVFVPQPGPDSDASRAIVQRISGQDSSNS